MGLPSNAVRMISLKWIWEDKYLNQASVEMLYEPAAALDQQGVQTACSVQGTAIGNRWREVADVDCKLSVCYGRYLDWTDMANIKELVAYSAVDLAGTQGGLLDAADPLAEIESLPPVMAFLVRKHTEKAGRPYRGRLFVPYISEECVHDGIVDEGDTANFKLLAAAFGTSFETNNTAGGPITCHARLWAQGMKDTSTEDPGAYITINKLEVITSTDGAAKLVTRRDRRYRHRNLTLN